MPVLRQLLLAAGFGGVTSWDRRDSGTFPVRWITHNAEAVIDLLGCTEELAEAARDHAEMIIITDDTSWTVLTLPGPSVGDLWAGCAGLSGLDAPVPG